MEKYIDPTSDLGFKLLFGREKISEPVLVDLLNALLCSSEGFEEIKTVSYLNNERSSEWKDGKSIRYDIMCETSSGHRFIVEMQKASQPKFIDRATFYMARGIAEQGYRGKKEEELEWDYSLKPVIGVFLCNFHVPALDRKPIVRAATLDEDTFKPIGVKTRYIFVQLPFFNKEEEECKNLDDKWIYNIKNMGIRQEVAFRSNSEIFKRLAEVANVATLTPEQRYHYEADVKNARDTLNQIRGAYQEGEAKGRAEGEAKGRAEGKAEGEADAKKAIARKMLKNGLGISMIASFTGLSESEIESL
ncbi:MAG: Rpn family recombination-promoting nuclease/putative transposase [Muribaculaceae bacterium]|nr:Rpn family recombination-promoting nuclease/putative transposase [Muribaculaceae bacterium]